MTSEFDPFTEVQDSHPLYAFAGIDGAGKSTLINGIATELRIQGHEVFISKAYTQEHKDAFHHFVQSADDIEMMFMFQAFARRQRNDTLAHLALNKVVLADRWSEPFEAYHSQNGSLEKKPSLRHALNDLAFEGLTPHITFYVRTKTNTAMRRTSERGPDFFDSKIKAYHERQAAYYDERAHQDESWITLDGHKEPEELTTEALVIIRASHPFQQIELQ